MNKENFINFNSDTGRKCFENNCQSDFNSSDETTSHILLHPEKRKVKPIKYLSEEENDVELEKCL